MRAALLPCFPKVPHGLAIAPRKNKFLGTLVVNQSAQENADRVGHCYFSAIPILGGSGVESNCPLNYVNLAHSHVQQFRHPPTIRPATLNKPTEPKIRAILN